MPLTVFLSLWVSLGGICVSVTSLPLSSHESLPISSLCRCHPSCAVLKKKKKNGCDQFVRAVLSWWDFACVRVLLKVIDGSTLLFPCPCFFIYFFVCGGGNIWFSFHFMLMWDVFVMFVRWYIMYVLLCSFELDIGWMFISYLLQLS